MKFHPNKRITKILISSTSRFVGEFIDNDLLITHARASSYNQIEGTSGFHENPLSRNYYVIVMETPETKKGTVVIPNYTYMGDAVTILMSILFGKRFDNHGRIESTGNFYLPDISSKTTPCISSLAYNNHKPRKNLNIALKLNEFERIFPLLTDNFKDEIFLKILFSAGRFYVHALQEAEQQPAVKSFRIIINILMMKLLTMI